jgi:hypothetical protein
MAQKQSSNFVSCSQVWGYGDILLIKDDIKLNVKMTHFLHVMNIKTTTQNLTIFLQIEISRQRIVQLSFKK